MVEKLSTQTNKTNTAMNFIANRQITLNISYTLRRTAAQIKYSVSMEIYCMKIECWIEYGTAILYTTAGTQTKCV